MTIEEYACQNFGKVLKIGTTAGSSFIWIGLAEHLIQNSSLYRLLDKEIFEAYDSYYPNTKIVIYKGTESGRFWTLRECKNYWS